MDQDKQTILREISIDSSQHLVDFEGRVTDHQSFANKKGLTFTLTVLFMNGPSHWQSLSSVMLTSIITSST